jgi:hypothetical protein
MLRTAAHHPPITPSPTLRVMPIDLLPFSAYALESSRAPARIASESQTLTLQLAQPLVHAAYPAVMSGTIVVSHGAAREEGVLRAAVLPANHLPLTLTF